MTLDNTFFAAAPRGLEPLLAAELKNLGASSVSETRAGVSFEGTLETALRACLWSRLASRILLPLASFDAAGPEELYDGAREIPWEDHMEPDGTLAVDCTLSSSAINHSNFAALKVKDAAVDRFRDRFGLRPSVETTDPDLRIYLHLHRDRATIGIDLSGESLHRRGYREEGAAAPLKENLAAAILLYSGWPALAAEGSGFIDPMCGSGTLAIESALIAADIAPGLLRERFGFLRWKERDDALWQRLVEEAQQRREEGLKRLPPVRGFDRDATAISAARENARRAGLAGKITLERHDVAELTPPQGEASGLIAVNPPYGERLGKGEDLDRLYALLGERMRLFTGWKGAVFTGGKEYAKRLGLRSRKVRTLRNGALECLLLHFDIEESRFHRELRTDLPPEPLSEGAEMFANRLRKNLKTLGKWAAQEGISCYRLYDADMPEYALAIDCYGRDTTEWVHVQEYEPPKSIDPDKAQKRLREAMAAIPSVLDIPRERIALKVRRRGKGGSTYQKLSGTGELVEVQENGLRFLVNFTDYLDTGLFLDHRVTRKMVGEMASGKRFLNLFAYTGTATVYAARGGAVSTVTVDMSNTYLAWAERNLALNGFSGDAHRFVRADCLEWIERERGHYDLIFLDPPTFSNSKKMEESFDVQRDHVRLLSGVARLLSPGGILVFSTNNRRFRMDYEALSQLAVEDVTQATIPKDFGRNPRIHVCFRITRR